MNWINIHKYYNSFTKPPEYIFGDSKFGSYTIHSENQLTLSVLNVFWNLQQPGQSLEIYNIFNLFNIGRQVII